jgi:prepilin-type N-terminal cleavage/methylation domain-containing protein
MEERGIGGLAYRKGGDPGHRQVIRLGPLVRRGEGCGPSAAKEAAKQKGHSGFTLLEVVVAMVLVAMVTLTVAFAFKVGIGAWERGTKEGEDPQVRMIIPALIHRQMTAAVRTNPFVGMAQSFALCGNQNSLTFFTAYAPEGSPRQGLMRVFYEYNEEEQTLSFYEQIITDKEDLEDESGLLSKDWKKDMIPLSKTEEIKLFEVSYGAGGMDLPLKEDDWKDEWKCDSSEWPDVIRLRFQTGEGPRSRAGAWIFRSGVMGMQVKEQLMTQGEAGQGDAGTRGRLNTRTGGSARGGGTLGRGNAGTRRQGAIGTRDRSRRLK